MFGPPCHVHSLWIADAGGVVWWVGPLLLQPVKVNRATSANVRAHSFVLARIPHLRLSVDIHYWVDVRLLDCKAAEFLEMARGILALVGGY